MLIVRLTIAVHLAVAGDVFDGVFLCCPFFSRDVLDEIWDLMSQCLRVFLPTLQYSGTGLRNYTVLSQSAKFV